MDTPATSSTGAAPEASSDIVVLCGGVGAARFLTGLTRVVDPARVTAIVNVGDDAVFHGLHISPDIDTVMYTLAGLVDPTHGWGVADDTFQAEAMLGLLGRDTWFHLGDRDLAVHVRRTERLRAGAPLSAVTDELRRALGVGCRIVPATDDRQATFVRVAEGWLPFQEYFVRRQARDAVLEVRFEGEPRPAPGVRAALASAEVVIVAPSNPIVSIGPILAVAGVREALRATSARVTAVSPIVGGAAIKGPAAAMLASLGHEVSPAGVGALYADFLDVLVIDEQDAGLAAAIRATGLRVAVAQTVMADTASKEGLARATLAAAAAR